MPFDPAIFEAQTKLGLLSTDQLPATALDAMEAGFDGPQVLRMAILDPKDGWAIDRALPGMLAELGQRSLTHEEAGILLAQRRARQILDTSEGPLPHLNYFYRLMVATGYSHDLSEIGWLEEDVDFGCSDDCD